MRVHIENIGVIEEMDVDFEGITIIGGENNTGKSTIGKIMFACYQNMAEWGEFYSEFVKTKIEKYLEIKSAWIEDYCLANFSAKRRRTSKAEALRRRYSESENFRIAIEDFQVAFAESSYDLVDEIISSIDPDIIENLHQYLEQYCIDYMQLYAKRDEYIFIENSSSVIQNWVFDTITGFAGLQIDELNAQAKMINNSFENIFKKQHIRIGYDNACIKIIDNEEREIELYFTANKLVLSAPIRTVHHVYYLESPKIYDLLSRPIMGMSQTTFLRMLLSPNFIERNPLFYSNLRKQNDNALDDVNIIAIDSVLSNLRDLMGGQADYYQKVGVEFKDDFYKDTIHPQNVSTGLKSIALLEYALRIGVVLPGDILILDEPEINLHPKWQIEYAKLLVFLQKTYNLKIVISSHSPYFIRAIEIFCDKYDTMDKLNVYMTERTSENGIMGTNLSYSEYGMSELYELLASPLDDLERLLEEE
ncbi:MAG: AAA family ATPase [Eubacterium sp.]|nr:AAA family ATPase [Eubacterium sp.]MCI6996273.1 AAA family ATPase [Eubacterium sp.]